VGTAERDSIDSPSAPVGLLKFSVTRHRHGASLIDKSIEHRARISLRRYAVPLSSNNPASTNERYSRTPYVDRDREAVNIGGSGFSSGSSLDESSDIAE